MDIFVQIDQIEIINWLIALANTIEDLKWSGTPLAENPGKK